MNFHEFLKQLYVVVFCYNCDEYEKGMITKSNLFSFVPGMGKEVMHTCVQRASIIQAAMKDSRKSGVTLSVAAAIFALLCEMGPRGH